MTQPNPTFNRYYRYAELQALLQDYATAYPHLIHHQSIGQSHEGRRIDLITITNKATGDASQKPSLWVDGNIHATEVAPSTAALYLIHTLVTQYDRDPDITRCLDTRAFHICPRLNPDGAELALADSPRYLRSGTRYYPDPDPLPAGFTPCDIDGDGRILTMRIPDPNGAWKAYPPDPRWLIRRDPIETGGEYYRLLPEGEIENHDGVLIPRNSPPQGLDFNRNFPAAWRPEPEQRGAGPYPTSEPEVRAAVEFVTQQRNLTGVVSFHTMSGVLLRPFSFQADETMAPADLRLYQQIGAQGTAITGYPAVSVYHEFRTAGQGTVTGAFDDWAYLEQGLLAWTVEIWSPMQQAGIEKYHFLDWFDEHPLEDDLKLLAWSDRELQGHGYIDWYPVEHPQLGPVELGGWHDFYSWRNPPPHLLQGEIQRFPQWLVWHLLISPLLTLHHSDVTPLGNDCYRVRVVVENSGWLPTYVTEQAKTRQKTRGCRAAIQIPEGVTLVTGSPRLALGELTGRSHTPAAPSSWGDKTSDRAKAEWIVSGPAGAEVTVTVQGDRAGQVTTSLTLA
ncbi:M14 family metallopeptidase [Spirulina major CS-329]|uniref:M14 family metallopeptidase n=1 Tax=Spirulina TaxID=1154 RepID=UPI00232C02E9|nr:MULTISPECIES: M14 family metallopeptidase [Spirulina]MDB9495462.1 M14 family metallopeptidase [Spirulina subsalsa CS-330]MDB9505107.1 M14 family metallopeptidase [Spirulina major CS-329]